MNPGCIASHLVHCDVGVIGVVAILALPACAFKSPPSLANNFFPDLNINLFALEATKHLTTEWPSAIETKHDFILSEYMKISFFIERGERSPLIDITFRNSTHGPACGVCVSHFPRGPVAAAQRRIKTSQSSADRSPSSPLHVDGIFHLPLRLPVRNYAATGPRARRSSADSARAGLQHAGRAALTSRSRDSNCCDALPPQPLGSCDTYRAISNSRTVRCSILKINARFVMKFARRSPGSRLSRT